MTKISGQNSEVSSQKLGRGLTLSPLPFALSLVGALLLALCLPADAQQPEKVPRVGFLSGAGAPSRGTSVEAFRQGLRDFGYVEGKNILVEYRYPEGGPERIRKLLTELVQLKVDILVVAAGVRAAQQATRTIPIVMVTTGDPVAAGLVDSLARPGGNITGLTRITRELSGKRLELFKEAVPALSRVGVLAAKGSTSLKDYEPAARALKIPLQYLEVQGPNPDLDGVFRAAAKGRANALVTILNPLLNRYRKEIADLAIKNRLPSMFESTSYVEAGGLMSYASDDAANFRRAAYYVTSQDPVATGMVESLARPGANITGVTRLTHELSGKRLELFKEVVPQISRVGILAGTGSNSLPAYEPAANALKISLDLFEVGDPTSDLAGAFQTMLKKRLSGLITVGSRRINPGRKQILEFVAKNRLPSMFEVSSWVDAGGLVSYSADDLAAFRRAAVFVDKILKGTKPADLPVEQAQKFVFVINLKTAKQIGLTVPPNVLARADRVIR